MALSLAFTIYVLVYRSKDKLGIAVCVSLSVPLHVHMLWLSPQVDPISSNYSLCVRLLFTCDLISVPQMGHSSRLPGGKAPAGNHSLSFIWFVHFIVLSCSLIVVIHFLILRKLCFSQLISFAYLHNENSLLYLLQTKNYNDAAK